MFIMHKNLSSYTYRTLYLCRFSVLWRIFHKSVTSVDIFFPAGGTFCGIKETRHRISGRLAASGIDIIAKIKNFEAVRNSL